MGLQVKLITKADIAVYKQISVTLKDDIIDEYILDAQIQDVAPLLGEKLFNAILKTPADYTDLLTAGEYTVGGETFTNYGLKAVLAYYAYARYKMFGSVVDTPYGFVEKLEGAESRPESDFSKKSLYNLNRDSAFTIWKSVENFLIRTKVDLYGPCGCNTPSKGSGGFILTKIGK